MIPKPHQVEFSQKIFDILKQKGYVYLSGKPRSGKTYTAILACELSSVAKKVAIITTKEARDGWYKFTENNNLISKEYHVYNYEAMGRRDKRKLILKIQKGVYDILIVDESHNIGKFPKPSLRHLLAKAIFFDLPHIHLSGTAIIESGCSIYHQMAISKYNPFKEFKNFYEFHKRYGNPYTIKTQAGPKKQYDRHKPELLDKINEFTIYMTQEDAGIGKEVQSKDIIHYVELDPQTRDWYNTLQTDKVLQVGQHLIMADSTIKERTALHMLESGVGKVGDEYVYFGNLEKINYIRNTFGDSEDIGVMCHFKGERALLNEHFNHIQVYSSNAHAEGTDLSHLRYFVILSSDYRGSKFVQRKERIINTEGSNTTEVHHILVKGAVSDQVYKKTSKKEDFNNSTYERKPI